MIAHNTKRNTPSHITSTTYTNTPRNKLIEKLKNKIFRIKKKITQIKKSIIHDEPINIMEYINIHNPPKLLRNPIQVSTNHITRRWSEH